MFFVTGYMYKKAGFWAKLCWDWSGNKIWLLGLEERARDHVVKC